MINEIIYDNKAATELTDRDLSVCSKLYSESYGKYDTQSPVRPGHEWLAFVFREQEIDKKRFEHHFAGMMRGYEHILRDAYSRMEIKQHPWAKGTPNEVDFIAGHCVGDSILDMFCCIDAREYNGAGRFYSGEASICTGGTLRQGIIRG